MQLHWGDALRLDLAALDPTPTALVANLPYNVATPLVMETLVGPPSARALVRDGATRDRRTVLRGARHQGVRVGLRRRPAPARNAQGSMRSHVTSSAHRPRVESALVAFRRGEALPRGSPEVTTRRRGGFRAPAQDARQLPGARRGREPRRGSTAALAATRPPAERARREPRTDGVRGARGGARAVNSVRGHGEDQPRACRRAATCRREARRRHRVAADRSDRPDLRRAVDALECRGLRAATRSSATRSSSSPRPRGRTPASPRRIEKRIPVAAGSRRRQLGCGDCPAAGEQLLPSPFGPVPSSKRLAAGLGADIPFFLRQGPQLGTGDGSTLSPLEGCRRTTGSCSALPTATSRSRPRPCTTASTLAAGRSASHTRRAALLDGLDAVRGSGDLGRLPRQRPRVVAHRRDAARRAVRFARTSRVPGRRCTDSSTTGVTRPLWNFRAPSGGEHVGLRAVLVRLT